MKISYDDIKNDETIKTYIKMADESLNAMRYTEHSFFHVTKVAELAGEILTKLGYSDEDAELARIAGYLHDIGNVINRIDHAQSGALMAFRILDKMGAEASDIAMIITAIGNHDEATAFPVNSVAAAIILADKTDVRYTRVRNQDSLMFDIHDRVNYAVKKNTINIEKDSHIELNLIIDTSICAVMEYFEIFIDRMILCRKAAEKLGVQFILTINNQRMI